MKPLTPHFLLLASLLVSLCSPLASADVYSWINEQGIRVYGDEPPADAKVVDLPKIQKLKPLKAPPVDKKITANNADQSEGYGQLNIISPKQESIITAGNAGNITVQLQISPGLQPQHEITLLVDGIAVKRGARLQFQLENIHRGSHLLQVQVKHRGKLLIASPKRRIHVQRPSILNRPKAN
ncbi:MAG: DUF4124 domain-containing protein [Bermanella sp.]|jgi:hypothetical protein